MVMPGPDLANEDAARIERVVKHLAEHNRPAALVELGPLIGVTCLTKPIVLRPVLEGSKRPASAGPRKGSLTERTIATVYKRDTFTCRYCERWTVPLPVLDLIHTAFPTEFPFHGYWRYDSTHRDYWDISASPDHIQAVTTDGHPTRLDNLATACARCNYQKSNRSLESLGWKLLPPDGRGSWWPIRHYRAAWEALGRPESEKHTGWFGTFGL
jgi:hypothetical protein